MSKRSSIPQSLKEQLLREFNHRCAICGADRPQIHHIDSNPSNNHRENLLPLCPNCHLTDQHNPTAPTDPRRLALFRKHKDPAILSPEFEPLFHRLVFLDSIADDANTSDLQQKAEELSQFVSALQMGQFYGKKMLDLLNRPAWSGARSFYGPDPEADQHLLKLMSQYRQQLRDARDKIYALAVELLRYQNWVNRGNEAKRNDF